MIGVLISIHTPLAGSDLEFFLGPHQAWRFQSTLPLRGVTIWSRAWAMHLEHFNPHSPCGE